MTVWNTIVGHEWAVALLLAAAAEERAGHAYLFTGPSQVGKTTLARTFAMALNCLEPEPAQRPCGHCRACQLIAADRHPDVRLLQPEVSGRGQATIKIDQIRQLQQDLNLTATEARYKVAILKQFDAANANAANAFLKTLEEPPHRVVLLLTATDAETLLPTISSRCRVVALRPLPAPVIEAALLARDLAPADARLLAHLANGRLGWAIHAGQEPAILRDRAVYLDQLHTALQGDLVDRFALAERLASKAEALPPLLETWLDWWRDLVILASDGTSTALHNVDEKGRLERLAARITPDQALRSLRQTDRALWQLAHNANTRLVVENLLLVYPASG